MGTFTAQVLLLNVGSLRYDSSTNSTAGVNGPEMTLGMGIPWEWECPWVESYGNGNKTPTWELGWEGVGMNVDGNGNDPYSYEKKFPGISAPLRYSTLTDVLF